MVVYTDTEDDTEARVRNRKILVQTSAHGILSKRFIQEVCLVCWFCWWSEIITMWCTTRFVVKYLSGICDKHTLHYVVVFIGTRCRS